MFSLFWLVVYCYAATSLEMNDILKELTWPLKLKILNDISDPNKKTTSPLPVGPLSTSIQSTGGRVEAANQSPANIESASPANIESASPSNIESASADSTATPTIENYLMDVQPILRAQLPERRVGIQLLREAERRAEGDEENDEKDMRLKLFRLMYETVRDSDLKVKRAELIKEHYSNSSSFEIGYLIGDITDKASIITDISMTLRRFHKEWKPIEHINAYEQISNQAIEITHLIDLVRVVNKRDGS